MRCDVRVVSCGFVDPFCVVSLCRVVLSCVFCRRPLVVSCAFLGGGGRLSPGVYSGEKIDELRHGLGTLVFPNGDKYIGQFHQGMRHGRGELTCAPKRAVVTAAAATAAATGGNPPCQRYAGQWMLSKRHGRGVETWPNGDKYDGEYKVRCDRPAGFPVGEGVPSTSSCRRRRPVDPLSRPSPPVHLLSSSRLVVSSRRR